MSAPARQEAQPENAVLDAEMRVRYWWGIYLGGSFLFPVGMVLYPLTTASHPNLEAMGSVLLVPVIIALLPIGLAYAFGSLIAACLHEEWHPLHSEVEGWALLAIPLAYALFALHLHLTAKANTRRAFLLLLLSLVLLVTSSLVGCVREASQPVGMQQ